MTILCYKHPTLSLSFKQLVAAVLVLFLLCSDASPEALTVSVKDQKDEKNLLYKRGLELAKNERFCSTSLATGFIVGVSVPFLAGGSAALAYQSANDCTACSIVAAFAVPSLVIWGGHKLNSKYSVAMPEKYGMELCGEDLTSFTSGYEHGKKLKRQKDYNLGITMGVLSVAGTIIYLIYRLDYINLSTGV